MAPLVAVKNNELTGEQKLNVRTLIEKLRSGEYEQTKNVLKSDVGHCCLGVAAEGVLHREFAHNYAEANRLGLSYVTCNSPSLTPTDAEKFGFNIMVTDVEYGVLAMLAPDKQISEYKRYGALMFLNDSGVPFDVIANVIENFGWDK